MTAPIYDLLMLSDLVDGIEMTPDLIKRLVALAFMQARIAATEIKEKAIPCLPPARRNFAVNIMRRIEQGSIFDDAFMRDLDAISQTIDNRIDEGTHVYWQSDEHHTRGGYEVSCFTPEVSKLDAAARELALLRDVILATTCSARASGELDVLLSL